MKKEPKTDFERLDATIIHVLRRLHKPTVAMIRHTNSLPAFRGKVDALNRLYYKLYP
jgi:hypothetical protein